MVTANATPSKDVFSSFRNGSGAIPNSCHQDALLVILNEIFMRNQHFLNATGSTESQCMQTLKEMHKLFRHENFIKAK